MADPAQFHFGITGDARMSRPEPKGWCPGAYRPMMSGDGLVVRVRPRLARLTTAQALGLCRLSQQFGNGIIDLTSRANLQIRGVAEADHDHLLERLKGLDLLPDDPALEGRRNILITPDWVEGDETCQLVTEIYQRLGELPELPAKFGFAVDTGAAPVFGDCSADIRIERTASGGLILRADGAVQGLSVSVDAAVDLAIRLAHWFEETRTPDQRRMATLIADTALPEWATGTAQPSHAGKQVQPGQTDRFWALGVAFGQIDADSLADLIRDSHALAMRVTPWRVILLEAAHVVEAPDFVTDADDPVLNADACPGTPLCNSASVATRDLARKLAPHVAGRLHVSGCAKGCARARASDVTLVGRDGAFDLVLNGHSWDAPQETGLSEKAILERFGAS